MNLVGTILFKISLKQTFEKAANIPANNLPSKMNSYILISFKEFANKALIFKTIIRLENLNLFEAAY